MLQTKELVTRHVPTVFDVNKFRMHTSGFKFRKCLNHHDHLVDPQNLLGNLIQNLMKNMDDNPFFQTTSL